MILMQRRDYLNMAFCIIGQLFKEASSFNIHPELMK